MRENEHEQPRARVKRARPGSGDKHWAQTTPGEHERRPNKCNQVAGPSANEHIAERAQMRRNGGMGRVSRGWRRDKGAQRMQRRQQEWQQQGRGGSGRIRNSGSGSTSSYMSSTCSSSSCRKGCSRSRGYYMSSPSPLPPFIFPFIFIFISCIYIILIKKMVLSQIKINKSYKYLWQVLAAPRTCTRIHADL